MVYLIGLVQAFIIGYLFYMSKELRELKHKIEFPWLYSDKNGLYKLTMAALPPETKRKK
jgi:hypothetical protein